MPLPSAISQAKTSNALWILSLLIVGCGHDPSLEMDVPVAESSDPIADALSTTGSSNTSQDLAARLSKLEDAQRSLSISLLRVSEQLRQVSDALEAVTGEEVISQNRQDTSVVNTSLAPIVTSLDELRDLLVTAHKTRDPELLYALYPKRAQYEFVLGTRKQLVSDRLTQIELEKSYSEFFNAFGDYEAEAINEMMRLLRTIKQNDIAFLENTENIDFFVFKEQLTSEVDELRERAEKGRNRPEITWRGLFTGIRSSSDVVLEDLCTGYLVFEHDHQIASIAVLTLKLDGQWFIMASGSMTNGISSKGNAQRIQMRLDDDRWELVSDNSSRLSAILSGVEDGTIAGLYPEPIYIGDRVGTNSTLDSTNTTGSVDGEVADPGEGGEEAAEGGSTNSTN